MEVLEDIQLNRMGREEVNKIRDRKLAEGLMKCYNEFEDLFY
jgi:hypothetical protein